jgi:cytoskeleton protein RodZ
VNELAHTIAETLAHQRELKGLTIAQLSAKTKISERFIEAMEKGDFSFLPMVYVRAFLRNLAGELGLDPEVMVRQVASLSESGKTEEKVVSSVLAEESAASLTIADVRTVDGESKPVHPGSMPASDQPKDYRMVIVSGISVLAILLIALFFILNRPKDEAPLFDAGTIVEKPEPMPTAKADSSNLIPLDVQSEQAQNLEDQLNLTIQTIDTAWVRIVYQDSLVDEGMFAPGGGRNWISYNQFYLKIGNAGGVHLFLNGQDLGMAGARGRTASLRIDKTGLVRITDDEFPAIMKLPQHP